VLPGDILECTNFYKLHGESGCRHQPVLDSPWRADKQNVGGVLLFQFLRNGERRNYVSAGSASCQNRTHNGEYKLE
jgi:hypothetical protein